MFSIEFPTARIADGKFRDGMFVNARELAESCNMSHGAARRALVELEREGFIVNMTPELPIDKAVVRLTMFPYQGKQATEDYERIPRTPDEQIRLAWLDRQDSKFRKLQRRTAGGRR
jgi:hypothetical protein